MLPATMAVLGLTGTRPPDTCHTDPSTIDPDPDPRIDLEAQEAFDKGGTLGLIAYVQKKLDKWKETKVNILSLFDTIGCDKRVEVEGDMGVEPGMPEKKGDIHPQETPSTQVEVGVAFWVLNFLHASMRE